jgi:hypothetical protein
MNVGASVFGMDINDLISFDFVFNSRRPNLEFNWLFISHVLLNLRDLRGLKRIVDGFPEAGVSHVNINFFFLSNVILSRGKGTMHCSIIY